MATQGPKTERNSALHAVLRECEGQHVHFFPKIGNCGDGFISYATYRAFEAYNIRVTAHRQADTVHDSIVFIGGGGNLIEGLYNHVADIIRAHCHSNKVILLPHTIVGFQDILKETYTNLRIFCRDLASYEAALKNGANKDNLYLAHDMTFYLDDDHFDRFLSDGAGVLNAFRIDAESADRLELPEDNIDISRSWDGDIWTSRVFSEYATKSLFAFVSQFEVVLTDRLHVSIIASFLNKRVVLFPNSYFKNSAVYAHSMQHRFPRTVFCGSPESRESIVSLGISLPLPTAHTSGSRSSSDEGSKQIADRGRARLKRKSLLQRIFRL